MGLSLNLKILSSSLNQSQSQSAVFSVPRQHAPLPTSPAHGPLPAPSPKLISGWIASIAQPEGNTFRKSGVHSGVISIGYHQTPSDVEEQRGRRACPSALCTAHNILISSATKRCAVGLAHSLFLFGPTQIAGGAPVVDIICVDFPLVSYIAQKDILDNRG